jgi:hypothetical protein
MVVGFPKTVQSVPISTKVASLNPAHGEMYLIPQYVIKFVSDFQQVGGFLRVIRFPPSIHQAKKKFNCKDFQNRESKVVLMI